MAHRYKVFGPATPSYVFSIVVRGSASREECVNGGCIEQSGCDPNLVRSFIMSVFRRSKGSAIPASHHCLTRLSH